MLMQGGENPKPGPEAASSLTDTVVQCCCLVLGLERCPDGIRVLQYQALMGPAGIAGLLVGFAWVVEEAG